MSNKIIKNVNFSSLNCKNLKGNLIYSQYLAEISDLSFYSETWTYPNDLPIIKQMASSSNNFFYHKSDMKVRAKGRPFGGQLWLVNKKFNIIECNFLCRHSSYVNFMINNIEFLCVGLYLPFDDSKNKDNSKAIFELTLSKVLALIERHKDKNIPIILMGDFNADIHRNNRFDDILKKFILDNEMIVLDDIANTSDHRAINYSFQLETTYDTPNTQTEKKLNSVNPNFENPVVLNFYQLKVEEKINATKNKLIGNYNQDQKFIDELYKSLCDIFVESSEETLLHQNTFIKTKDHNNGQKKKPPLNEEQKEIVKKMKEMK